MSSRFPKTWLRSAYACLGYLNDLMFWWFEKTTQGTQIYKDFTGRKEKVFRLLYYLKANNPYYADITILHPNEVNLPVNANILDRLPVVKASPTGSFFFSSEDGV